MATTPKGIYYPNDYNEIADIPEDMKKMAESIDEVFENTDSDLSDIKEEQTTQNNRLNSLEVDNTTNKSDILTNKQEINNIKTEQTEQNTNISTNATNIESLQEENENLKKVINQLPQVEGQGTEVTLENTIEAPFTIFDVEGNSVQDGTPSPDNEQPIYSAGDNENLVNESNINFTYSSVNKVIYDNGLIKTINLPNGQFYEFDEPLQSGETYTLTFKFVQGRVNVQGSQDFSIGMYHSGNNNSWQGNLTKTQIANIDLAGKTFTLTHKATDTITGLYIFIYSSPTFVTPLWFNVKVEKGNKATPYSPHGMGSINEKIQTRNLFDKNNIIIGKRLDGSGLPTVTDNDYFTTNYFIKVKPNTIYHLTSIINQSKCICCYDKNKNFIERLIYLNTYTFTTTNDTAFIKISMKTNEIDTLQLEQGSTATPYVPYEEQDYSIFVQQPMMDDDHFDRKNNKEVHTWIKYVLDGSDGENWSIRNNKFFINDNVNYNLWEKSISPNGKSNIGVISYSVLDNQTGFGLALAYGLRLNLENIDASNGGTIEQLRAYLAEHPITIYVKLKDSAYEKLPCTPEQVEQLENLPSTYKDFTIIQSEDETPAYLEVSGIRDIDTMFDKVTNAIVSLGGNV